MMKELPKIVLVDDENDDLFIGKRLFQMEFKDFFDFEIYNSPIDAIIQISEWINNSIEIPVIISDFRMPIMNGIEFFIQVSKVSPDSSLILISKEDVLLRDILINKSNIFSFLQKPYSQEEYIENIKEFNRKKINLIHGSSLEKSIEFSKEDYQAGLGILNFFGTYLNESYPEEKAKVIVQQDGRVVRMIIENKSGNKEMIEKALEEYSLIIGGKEAPEKFISDPAFVIQMKSELMIAQTRLETQKDVILLKDQIIQTQNNQVQSIESKADQLMHIIGEAMTKGNTIHVNTTK